MNQANKKTILTVDDSLVIRKMLKGFLKDDFDVIEAESPKECLKTLASTTPKIDLGLIDIEMPDMNGFQLIKMIRKHPSYTDVPFIMVTSRDDKKSVGQAVIAGACGYIRKPFDRETLLQKIQKHLKDTPPAPETQKKEQDQKDEDDPSSQWEFVEE